jgi:hypothetical protein
VVWEEEGGEIKVEDEQESVVPGEAGSPGGENERSGVEIEEGVPRPPDSDPERVLKQKGRD